MPPVVYAGAAHWDRANRGASTAGLFRLGGGNGGWQRLTEGLPADVEVRAIAISAKAPETVYVGTQKGPSVSTDGGRSWRTMALPGEKTVVWSILLHPEDPDTLYVGAEDLAIYKTRDGGRSWRQLPTVEPVGLCRMGFPSRVIRLALDPSAPDEIYAGIEVGGVIRSLDGGESWRDISAGLLELAKEPHLKSRIGSDTDTEGMMDSHALAVSPAAPGTVILATRMGLFRSPDKGEHWEEMGIGRFSPLTYARDVQVFPHDPKVMHAALSVAATSDAGSLYQSRDLGQTWSRLDHDVSIDSTLMIVATSARDPARIWCAARRGQVFGSEDGGTSWREVALPAGVEGVYALACA